MWWNLGKRKTKVQFNPAKDDISEQARGFVHSMLLLRIRKPSAHDPKLIDSQLVQPQPQKKHICALWVGMAGMLKLYAFACIHYVHKV